MAQRRLTPVPQAWAAIWKGVRDLSEQFGNRLVFIGGLAVYLHIRSRAARFAEFSHDADFLISLADLNALRDTDEVTTNLRLKKRQLIRDGVDFDIYPERGNGLVVDYPDAERASVVIDQVRVACIEHLLLLKLTAYEDRRGSGKGDKDARDVIRLCYLLANRETPIRGTLLRPYLTDTMVSALREIGRSAQFTVMCKGNAHQASGLRREYLATVERLIRLCAARK